MRKEEREGKNGKDTMYGVKEVSGDEGKGERFD